MASSADELLASPAVDVVYIAPNDDSHAEYAVPALRAGEGMYVEKPMTVSHQQIKALCSANGTCAKNVFAEYNRRFSRVRLRHSFAFTCAGSAADPSLPRIRSSPSAATLVPRPEKGTRLWQ
jgi:hypothetical protein